LNGNDVGLYLSSETEDWVRANVHDCSFDENNDAIWIEDVGDSLVVIDNCSVTNSTTNGIYIQGAGDVEITRNAISDGTIGIYCYQSSPDIRSRNVIEGNGAGIKCDYYAYAAVESCTVTGNTNGVAVVNYANPDLGHVSGGTSLGANILNENTTYFVSNLTGNTISAENNYWGGLSPNCYPKGTKIYGSVDYAPALCTAPALAPAFMEVPAAEADVPTRFALSQNYPNPFNPVTTVTYSVPNPGGFVRIELFDVAGRLVTRLVNEQKSAGVYQAIWNGRNEKGQPAATGVYFVRMQSGSFVETRKLLMLK